MLRAAVARRLENGSFMGPVAQVVARGVGIVTSRTLARPVALPEGRSVVTVGGATLGGSGKTRLALSCVRELADQGARVALVGHAYRARPGHARVVWPSDALAEVGDEALACARELGGRGDRGDRGDRARVIVAPSRQAAVDLAATLADVIVIDGPLQSSPVRAALALLAVDAAAPWGSGGVVPAGDLRAPRAALVAHADLVVPIPAAPTVDLALEGVRFALFTAVARPHRLVRALPAAPVAVVSTPDHGPATSAAREVARWDASVDVWLATAKCAIHLESLAPRRPIRVLPAAIDLPPEVRSALSGLRKP